MKTYGAFNKNVRCFQSKRTVLLVKRYVAFSEKVRCFLRYPTDVLFIRLAEGVFSHN